MTSGVSLTSRTWKTVVSPLVASVQGVAELATSLRVRVVLEAQPITRLIDAIKIHVTARFARILGPPNGSRLSCGAVVKE
jgi:hypothetical protein